ncbi:MAG: tRNA (adenosine(37)-N6)-threonylcarbamoyltransferase complex ATPase subunit type 1 TsaE [Candidatus Coatesbacteria bacterium]
MGDRGRSRPRSFDGRRSSSPSRRPPRSASSLVTRSVRGTEAAGARLARTLVAGDCVCLIGPLGAGKTAFVRGALRALGVRRPAASPTFVLAREGSGRVPVAHLDFYRLRVRAEERGLLDYLDGRHVVFVEWADRDPSFWPGNAIVVVIEPVGPARRRLRIWS